MAEKKPVAEHESVSKKEFAAATGTGLGGAILGALMSPLFNRNPAMSITRQLGDVLVANKDKLTAPFFSSLSKEDERMFEGISLCMQGKHGEMPYADILDMLLAKMGPWASDRFRSIVIGIPNPQKTSKKTVTKQDGTTEVVASSDAGEPSNDLRVLYLTKVIEDILRFGMVKDSPSGKPFVDLERGIDKAIENLRVRNVADAKSATAAVSRWWSTQPLNGAGENAQKIFFRVLGVEKKEDITAELLEAKFGDTIKRAARFIEENTPDPTQPKKNDTAGSVLRIARRCVFGAYPNAPRVKQKWSEGKKTVVIVLTVLLACLIFGFAYQHYMAYQEEWAIINQPIQSADEPDESAPKGVRQ
jgi:hypothetical protein